MKSLKNIICALGATVAALTFTQCMQAPQQAPVVVSTTCDSTPSLKIAYVDIDTLLTSYNHGLSSTRR